jgi:putative aldouronate transport system permease protein
MLREPIAGPTTRAAGERDERRLVRGAGRRGPLARFWRQVFVNRVPLLMLTPGLAYFIVFHYVPMVGIVLAFKRYHVNEGIFGSAWVGLQNFDRFFGSFYAQRIITNAILLNVLTLCLAFPMAILLALALNEVRSPLFKRAVQSVTYFPYFISAVVMVGIVRMLLDVDPTTGVVNQLRVALLHQQPIDFVSQPDLFRPIYIGMVIWQTTGFGAIIYLASLAAVDVQLYEAAIIDGANRLQLIRHISLPALAATIVILLLLSIGSLLKTGIETILAFYSPAIYSTADVIETFVYRRGIIGDASLPPDYSFATAVGLFQSLVGLVLIVIANTVAHRVTDHGLW